MFGEDKKICTQCPRECKADRTTNPPSKKSICRAPLNPKIALVSLHQWEEPCLSGTKGAGTVFFSHCNLKCCFCQNNEISALGFGKEVSIERLTEIFLEQQKRGAHCLELVSSSHYADCVCTALQEAKKLGLSIPVALNSNGYEKLEAIENYRGLVDIYLPDLKYFDSRLAEKYSGVPHYFETASKAIKAMVEQTGECRFENNLLKRGVIVRHLVLPSHYKDSINVVDWLFNTFKDKIWISLMNQYMPLYKASRYKEINRKLTTLEYQKVVRHALEIGVTNGFIQEGQTAQSKFIPQFDASGVEHF